MSDMTPTQRDIWAAIQGKLAANRVERHREGGRGVLYWASDSSAGVHQSFANPDGTDTVLWVTAYRTHSGQIVVEQQEMLDSKDAFWRGKIEVYRSDPHAYLIVDHRMYRIGQPRDGDRNLRGFGGREVSFRRINPDPDAEPLGTVKSTSNLWFNGRIPPKYHDQLPDNAVFEDDFNGPVFTG